MRLAKASLRSSLLGWLGVLSEQASAPCLEQVRAAMLSALQQCSGQASAALEIKLRFAKDIDELWYARPGLMHVISASRGEAIARQSMGRVTELFGVSSSGTGSSRFGALS